jgi:phage tail sheath protein FI
MVGKLNSPGILVREVDNTAFAPSIDSSIVGIVGFATKGPLDKPTLITNAEQLIKVFGEPSEKLPGQGLVGALEILEATNRIYFSRCASSNAVEANAVLLMGACPAVAVYASSVAALVNSKGTLTFNIDLSGASGTELIAETLTGINVKLTDPIFGANFTRDLGAGTSERDFFAAAYEVSAPDVAYIYGYLPGKDIRMLVAATSGDAADAPILRVVDYSGSIVGTVSASVIASGATFSSTSLNYNVRSLYPGAGYNLGTSLKTGEVTGVSVEIENVAGPYFKLNVNDKGYQNESFRLSLIGDNTFIETVVKTSETQTPLFSDFIKGQFSGAGISDTNDPLGSPATKLNELFTVVNSSLSAYYGGASIASGATARFVKPLNGTYALSGGTNGLFDNPGSQDGGTEGEAEEGSSDTLNSIVIGTAADKTGIYSLDDDNLNISMAVVPGFTNQDIQNALITLAETSQNFIAAVAPPYGINDTQDAVDWMNGRYLRTAAINNSYAAVYWPWVQVYSVFDERDRWLDPAIYAIRQMAYTDSVSEPWFAPAGFSRGRVTKPVDTEILLSTGDRDTLYDNNINPVVKFFPEGITIFGQKTAKRVPSATDRINVRRMMIFLRKTLLASSRGFVFEPNDAITWENVRSLTEQILGDIQARRGISEFRVICDNTVNTPLRTSRRELWCKVILRPTETAEYIIFEVNLTNNTSQLGA